MITTATPSALAAELAAATPTLTQDEQRLALTIYRLLADGRAVDRDTLAIRAGLEPDDVNRTLSQLPGIYLDDSDRVSGFWGLAIQPTAHRLIVEGRVLYAWCAWDTLFLPELLGHPARVQSRCPTTDQPVSLTVDGTDTSDVQPPATALSFLHRSEPFAGDAIDSFCHYVHFFASPAAADEWTPRHEGTFTVSLADGVEIARLVNRARYPSILTP